MIIILCLNGMSAISNEEEIFPIGMIVKTMIRKIGKMKYMKIKE